MPDDKPICRQVAPDPPPAEPEPLPLLERETILGAQDLPSERLDVPEWGGSIYVKSLTGAERDGFEALIIRKRESNRKTGGMSILGLKARLVILTACDAAGERLFKDDDIDALNAKSGAALDRIFQVAQRLSGLSAEDVEELEGNSSGDRSGDSGSS